MVLTLRRLAGPSACVGGWAVMQGSYEVGVLLVYFGFLWSLIEVLYDPFFATHRPIVQIIGIAVILVGVDVFTIGVVAVSAPYEIVASSSVPTYGTGSVINGIKWQDWYASLSFYIKNKSSTDYENFDAEVSTDLPMTELRQLHGLVDCKIAGTHQPMDVQWQSFSLQDNKPIGPANNPAFDYKVIPMDKNGNPIIPVSGADWSYRIRCDRLPANSEADFFSALEVVNEPSSGRLNQALFGRPQAAKWVTVNATFQTGGRPRKETISQCLMGKTCETY